MKNSKKTFYKEWIEPLLFAIIITQFVVTMVAVDGVSMMPNLRDGERIIIPKYETWLHKFGIGDFQRGDIIIFKPPLGKNQSFIGVEYKPFLIKRIIAKGGDTVKITNGEVYLNNKKLPLNFITDYWQDMGCWDKESPLANAAYTSFYGLEEMQEIVVPENHYFVMGDNRTPTGSEDSRVFGSVPINNIAGKAAFSIWPIFVPENIKYDCITGSTQSEGNNILNIRSIKGFE